MITYLQMFEMLKEELANKAELHFKLDDKISKDEFGETKEMENYLKSEEDWRYAEKKYTDFLANIAERDIRPNDVAALN